MKSNAAGQLLGYSIQFPRALLRLLQFTKMSQSVAIETFGDVAVLDRNSLQCLEEDKSSVRSFPVKDGAENLWKTFSNWIDMVHENDLDPSEIEFYIYSNCEPPSDALVVSFSKCSTSEEIAQIVETAKKRIEKITSDDVLKYAKKVLEAEIDLFKKILKNFSLQTTSVTSELYDEIMTAIVMKFIPENLSKTLAHTLSGWLQENISNKITRKESPIISFKEFHDYTLPLFMNYRGGALIDFATQIMPSREHISYQLKKRPIYIKQLELIGLSEDKMLEAVSTYFKATTNRQAWIENGIIAEFSARDFCERLISYNKTQHDKITLQYHQWTREDQGKMILNECKDRQETLANQHPPSGTIEGTYHALADDSVLGWHPNWKSMLKG